MIVLTVLWTVIKILLLILLLLLLLLTLLLSIKIGIEIKYDKKLSLKLKIGLFKYTLSPKKKKKINISSYSYKKHQKRLLKAQAKEEDAQRRQLEKDKEKARKKREEKAHPKEKTYSIFALIRMAIYLLKRIPPRLFRCFSVKIHFLHIKVATGNAAKTAIRYGYVSQGVAYFLALLENTTRLNRTAYQNTNVEVDFLESATQAQAHVTLAIRPIRLIPFGIYSLYHFITIRNTLLEEAKMQKEEATAPSSDLAKTPAETNTQNTK